MLSSTAAAAAASAAGHRRSGLDGLALVYRLDWPLHLVISEESIRGYAALFARFLKVGCRAVAVLLCCCSACDVVLCVQLKWLSAGLRRLFLLLKRVRPASKLHAWQLRALQLAR